MRRHQWHRSACAFWTYNEPWPNAAHGCVVEYCGKPKLAYYYSRASFAPVDVSAEYSSLACQTGVPFPLKLFAVSDRTNPIERCRLTAAAVDVRGRAYARESWRFDLAPETSGTVGTFHLNPPTESAGSVVLVQLRLADSEGEDLSVQTYTLGVMGQPPADAKAAAVRGRAPAVPDEARSRGCLRPLLTSPATGLELSIRPGSKSDSIHSTAAVHRATVRNRGKAPALFVTLDLDQADVSQCQVTDSGFDLLPSEARTVDLIAYRSDSRPANAIRLRAKAWNSRETSAPLHGEQP